MSAPDQDINWEDRALKAEGERDSARDHLQHWGERAVIAEALAASLQSKLSALVAAGKPFLQAVQNEDDPRCRDNQSVWESTLAYSLDFGHFRALALALSEAQKS